MYLTQRKWHHVPAQFQRLTAFAIIAVLAFSVGWAVGTYGPAAYTFLTTNRNAAPAAAPASGLRIPNSVAQAPAVAPAVVAPQTWPNVPVSGMGSVYDSGHFGGVTAPAVAPDQAQQGVMNYVRAHDAVEGQRAPAVAADQAQQGVMDYLRAHDATFVPAVAPAESGATRFAAMKEQQAELRSR